LYLDFGESYVGYSEKRTFGGVEEAPRNACQASTRPGSTCTA